MALTGRFNFKRSWFGKLMLEVEDEVKTCLLERAQAAQAPLAACDAHRSGAAGNAATHRPPLPVAIHGADASADGRIGAGRREPGGGAAIGGDGAQPHRGDAAAIEPLERVAVAWNREV